VKGHNKFSIFKLGTCKYGDACYFAHRRVSSHSPVKKTTANSTVAAAGKDNSASAHAQQADLVTSASPDQNVISAEVNTHSGIIELFSLNVFELHFDSSDVTPQFVCRNCGIFGPSKASCLHDTIHCYMRCSSKTDEFRIQFCRYRYCISLDELQAYVELISISRTVVAQNKQLMDHIKQLQLELETYKQLLYRNISSSTIDLPNDPSEGDSDVNSDISMWIETEEDKLKRKDTKRNSICDYYQCCSAENYCMLFGTVSNCAVANAYLWPREVKGYKFWGLLVDIQSPRNILRLYESIREAFNAKQLYFERVILK
jgi:hypothetical protein